MAGEPEILARQFVNESGDTLPYRILIPAQAGSSKEKFPLVLCLHGAGGRGNDNRSRGTVAFNALSDPEVQAKYPAFLLTPQCPADEKWVDSQWTRSSYDSNQIPISEELKLAAEILDAVIKEFPIDPNRIYVTGQSMGGFGTWDMIVRFPDLFAAAVPVCGAGDPNKADSIKQVPVWAFHGAKDPTVPPDGSRKMVDALKAVGGNVRYTEFPDVGHASWNPAWSEPELIPWLFEQSKD